MKAVRSDCQVRLSGRTVRSDCQVRLLTGGIGDHYGLAGSLLRTC